MSNDRFKFRVRCNDCGEWCKPSHLFTTVNGELKSDTICDVIIEQCTGLKDTGGDLFFDCDIGEFPNGDRFVVRCEDWIEFYVDWIGDPECDDQARDFYRIRNAIIIGNIHDNHELLEQKL